MTSTYRCPHSSARMLSAPTLPQRQSTIIFTISCNIYYYPLKTLQPVQKAGSPSLPPCSGGKYCLKPAPNPGFAATPPYVLRGYIAKVTQKVKRSGEAGHCQRKTPLVCLRVGAPTDLWGTSVSIR